MAWDEATGDALGRGARLLERLQRMPVGHRMHVDRHEMQDLLVPISLLDRPTTADVAAWLADRAGCHQARENVLTGAWVFERLPRDRWREATIYKRPE